MPITSYPFSAVIPGQMARPMLPIEIHNPHTGLSTRTWALIDTGADDCAMPAQYAAILGHDLLKGAVKKIGTGNGETNAYAHTTKIDIFGAGNGAPLYTITDTPIDFMPNLGVVLLGVRNFMSRFVLTVDYPNQCFSLKNP